MRKRNPSWQRAGSQAGFTLAEVTVAIGIIAIVIGSLVNGYLIAAKRSEWMALSVGAQALTAQRLEQVRAARWDPTANPPLDELVADGFPMLVQPLYSPLSGTNCTFCTNRITIRLVAGTNSLKVIRSESYWRDSNGRAYTNRLVLYRSPAP